MGGVYGPIMKSDETQATAAAGGAIPDGTVKLSEVLAYLDCDRWMTKCQAIAYAPVGWPLMHKAIKDGKLRVYGIGCKILLRKSDIDSWVKSGEILAKGDGLEG